MDQNELTAIKELFTGFKNDIDKNLENVTDEFKDFKRDIKEHIDKANGAHTDIELLKKDVEYLKEVKKGNTKQHEEFYANFKKLDRFVYKLSGGIILSGALVGTILKLLGKI